MKYRPVFSKQTVSLSHLGFKLKPRWTKKKIEPLTKSVDLRFTFEDGSEAYLAHHGVKGMKWGVHNEETKQKYGELGSDGEGLSGGGGGIVEDDSEDRVLTDEEKARNLISESSRIEVGGTDRDTGDVYISVGDYTGKDSWLFGRERSHRRVNLSEVPDGYYSHLSNDVYYDDNADETTRHYGINKDGITRSSYSSAPGEKELKELKRVGLYKG